MEMDFLHSKFPIGRLVATRAVMDQVNSDDSFAGFVSKSLRRYISCDWGDLCDSDKKLNEQAMKSGEDRLMGAYKDAKHPDWKLWIITEWDHSATTILFPSEY